MPFARDCSLTKGEAEPASAFLSPVARDYPNRAFRRFFMLTALRLFHQRTRWNVRGIRGKSRFCCAQLIHYLGRLITWQQSCPHIAHAGNERNLTRRVRGEPRRQPQNRAVSTARAPITQIQPPRVARISWRGSAATKCRGAILPAVP